MSNKMKTDNLNLRKNVETNEKYIQAKIILKFQSPKFSMNTKQHFMHMFLIKFEPLEFKFGANKAMLKPTMVAK